MKVIVPGKGILYEVFPNAFALGLALTKYSVNYSKELVEIRDKYGLAMGPADPFEEEKPRDYRVGAYIVNVEAYLKDEKEKTKIKK